MKKIALCSLLSVLAPCFAFSMEVGNLVAVDGTHYTRELGTLTNANGQTVQAYQEVWPSGLKEYRGLDGKKISGKGSTWNKPASGNASGTASSAGTATAAATKTFNAAGVAMGALEVAGGVTMMYDSVSEKDRKTNFGDVLEGAAGGAMTGHGGAWIFNSIPVGGQIAYGGIVAAGAIVGATGASLKIFSETDCTEDAVLSAAKGFTVFQCCHTSKNLSTMSNANYHDIGDYMFCPQVGMVSQCVQMENFGKGPGVNRDPANDKRLWDDKWEDCKERWCNEKPASGEMVQYYADYDKYCWDWKCADGAKKQGNKCVKKSSANTCDQYKAYPERYKCCLAGKATVWSTNDPANGQCICVDTAKEWKDGKCVAKNAGGNNEEPADQTKDKMCTYTFSANITCPDGAVLTYNTMQKEIPIPEGYKDCDDFKTRFASDARWLETWCAGHMEKLPEKPKVDQKLLNSATSNLNSFFQSAQSGASVWKDSEGKFNTTRLASDLTAGVVLGTVGGVVSGVVIKKKQVEKGFDALHCTVGGQQMADWGDEFRVEFHR